MKTTGLHAVIASLVAGLLLAGCGAKSETADAESNVKLIAGFEDAEVPKDWDAGPGKLSISEDHATEGKHALCVRLTKGQYPGVGVQLHGADWSSFDALRFSVYNTADDRRMSIRIDDVKSTKYSTRYNLEGRKTGVTLKHGANEVELAIGSLRQGTPESRGLDVTAIREFKIFFGGLDQSLTLFLDNVRLVRSPRTGPDQRVIADFDDVKGKMTPSAGTVLRTRISPDRPGMELGIEMTPEATYPGISLDVPSDWLGYDFLTFELIRPNTTAPASRRFSLKVVDGTGRRQTFGMAAKGPLYTVTLPVEAAGFTALGRISELVIFWGKPDKTRLIYLDNVRLIRAKHTNHPSRHDEANATDRLALDFSGVRFGRNTCFMVTAWIPLTDGTHRVVRCNAAAKKQTSYSIDADAFVDYAQNKPVRLWVVFLDHGVWNVCERAVTLEPTGQTKLVFTDSDWFTR